MTPAAIHLTLSHAVPPLGLAAPVAALWWARKDDWHKAHRLVMDEPGREAAWVHAWLQRVEGDLDNAHYWYRQARRCPADGEGDLEWNAIVAALLERGDASRSPR